MFSCAITVIKIIIREENISSQNPKIDSLSGWSKILIKKQTKIKLFALVLGWPSSTNLGFLCGGGFARIR